MEANDDLKEICGPQCWNGIEADLGRLKKRISLEIFRELSTW